MSTSFDISQFDRGKVERFLDLLTQKALFGLSNEENSEVDELGQSFGLSPTDIRNEIELLELTAASTGMAMENYPEAMPTDLRDSVLIKAGSIVGENASDNISQAMKTVGKDSQISVHDRRSVAPTRREWMAILAAAACLVVLLGNWNRLFPPPPQVLSVAELRAAFLETAPADLVQANWSPGTDELGTNVSGNVVWSTSQQKGFMNFSNLTVNDPSKEQYQLWIFESPTQKFPIDGGVFDITGDEVSVEIDPKIAAKKSVLFVVTVEPPGGVVVSDRKRIAALAEVKQSEDTQ